MIGITKLYIICDREIPLWCEAFISCNKSLYEFWHVIKERIDMFLGHPPPHNFVCESRKRQEGLQDNKNKLPTNHIQDMFDGRNFCRTCGPG